MTTDSATLPVPLPSEQPVQKKNVAVLKNRSSGPFGAEQTVYLCGTSHVSKKSCDDVRQLIQAVKPQVCDPINGGNVISCPNMTFQSLWLACTSKVSTSKMCVQIVMLELCNQRRNILNPVDPAKVSSSKIASKA